MAQDAIIIKSGKINEYLHHIDLKAYGKPRMLSIYLAEFDNCSILFDCGSSLDYKKVISYLKKNEISLSSIKYLITSHHHFDHNGGLHLLYAELKKYNPELKILTNKRTKTLL
ncbi:MAG: MBL fold metallo-hydrolase, partial [Promethearchaeota archaeon]